MSNKKEITLERGARLLALDEESFLALRSGDFETSLWCLIMMLSEMSDTEREPRGVSEE